MKKQDLKTGMQVELGDGKRCVVLLGTLEGDVLCRVDGTGGWLDLSHDDDLEYDHPTLTINKVYGNTCPNQFISVDMGEAFLLWERKEVIELTLDEIAEKFNINVKHLKIKK